MKETIASCLLCFCTGCASLPDSTMEQAQGVINKAQERVDKVQDILIKEAEDRVCLRMDMEQFRNRYGSPETKEAAEYWAYCNSILKSKMGVIVREVPEIKPDPNDDAKLTEQAKELLRSLQQ